VTREVIQEIVEIVLVQEIVLEIVQEIVLALEIVQEIVEIVHLLDQTLEIVLVQEEDQLKLIMKILLKEEYTLVELLQKPLKLV